MFEDILTVVWKERKGFLATQGSSIRTVLRFLLPTFMIAIILPIQQGIDYLDTANYEPPNEAHFR